MAFSGVNEFCKKCAQKCKQWKEVAVVHCPNYKSADSKHSEMAETGQG
jgi:hypothetical protein